MAVGDFFATSAGMKGRMVGLPVQAVLFFTAPDETVMERICGRRSCPTCKAPYHVTFSPPKQEGICDKCGGELYQRDDDKPETVGARLKVYHTQTAPLIDYYTKAGLVHGLEAEATLEQLTQQALAILRQLTGAGK